MVIQDTFSELWLTFAPHWLIATSCFCSDVKKIVTPLFLFCFLERLDGIKLLNVFFSFIRNLFQEQ